MAGFTVIFDTDVPEGSAVEQPLTKFDTGFSVHITQWVEFKF